MHIACVQVGNGWLRARERGGVGRFCRRVALDSCSWLPSTAEINSQVCECPKIIPCAFVCTRNAPLHRLSVCFLKLLSCYTTHSFPVSGCSMSPRWLHSIRVYTRALTHRTTQQKKLIEGSAIRRSQPSHNITLLTFRPTKTRRKTNRDTMLGEDRRQGRR